VPIPDTELPAPVWPLEEQTMLWGSPALPEAVP